MIFKHLKKIIGFVKKDKKSPKLGKIEEGVNFVGDKVREAISESKVIVEKLYDLQQTNYQLGLTQLEKGNLKEAIFRFKIVRKFWPSNYDSHLKLIYCYVASGQEYRAQSAIEYLLELDDGFKPQIEQAKIDASFYGKSPVQSATQPSLESSNEKLNGENVNNSNEVINL